ncbi:hypothetical protein GF362_04725 [Candidatus Dojkabacteria bacterium]|nr:hypothetical protein [Candidatus Dojkabacteria bacterium]
MPDKKQEKAKKVFVDLNEEIVFTIENVLKEEKEKIILTIPEHAILTSSLTNMKLLAREIAASNKLVILVTKNQLALSKSELTNLKAVKKVEEIDENTWDEAESLIQELKNRREQIKEKLISARQESTKIPNEKKLLEQDKEKTLVPQEYDAEEKETQALIKKPVRLKPKLVSIGGFEVMAGGDIKEETKFASQKPKKKPRRRTKLTSKDKSHTSFIGKDMRSVRSDFPLRKTKSHPHKSFKKKGIGISKTLRSFIKKITTGGLIKPIIIGILGLVILFFLLKTLTKANVSVTPRTESVSVSETISASEDISEVNLDQKQIPLRKLTKSRSTSDTFTTTQTKETGERARGVVDFYNKTENEITLQQGHIITTINSNLNFKLDDTVTIPPRISEFTPSTYENAPIVAESHGEQYNISATDVKISGYNTIQELSGRIYRSTEGGSSKQINFVSEEDVNKAKASMDETLRTLLKSDINNLLSGDDVLIPGSENFNEIAFTVNPEVGTEAESFDVVNYELEISVLIVDQKDLDQFADLLITSQLGIEEDENIHSDVAASIENVQLHENGSVTFDLKKSTDVKVDLDSNSIFNSIKGKNLDQARTTLSSNEKVENYEIQFSPFFLPKFMKKVPEKDSKIEINIED